MDSTSLRWCGTMVLAGSALGELVFRLGEERLRTIVANVAYHEVTTDKGEQRRSLTAETRINREEDRHRRGGIRNAAPALGLAAGSAAEG